MLRVWMGQLWREPTATKSRPKAALKFKPIIAAQAAINADFDFRR